MNPAEWRQETKKTLAQVAALVGCSSPTSVQRYERGEREVPNSIALAYGTASGGAVTAEDLNRARLAFLARQKRRAAERRQSHRRTGS